MAALLAGLLVRRNIGAEVLRFSGFDAIPDSFVDWFGLLQSRPLMGLSFLAVFDLTTYARAGVPGAVRRSVAE